MTGPASSDKRDVRAAEILKLLLGFFPRVEAKLSLLLTLNVGMLGVLASSLRPVPRWDFGLIAPALAVALLGASFWNLYRAALPQLMESDTKSLFYFRAIAEQDESSYIDAVLATDAKELERDLARQTWRNAVILTGKFARVDRAFRYTAIAAIPWAVWLAIRSA
ncbi:MAG: Pycsar system effector family protein [Gemmatimonadaceae bacterium]